MRYLYGVTDEPYPRDKVEDEEEREGKFSGPLDSYKFRLHRSLKGVSYYDKNDVSILFKATPNSLLHLSSIVVDKLPLPCALEWNNIEVCKFIRNLGYPQYQRTFRKNRIDGRKLLLIRAVELTNMNIKNFVDIKHIAYSIRCLFYFEMTKFSRSLSLAPEYHYELYKIFRTQSGKKYELTRRTDLWRQLHLLRKEPKLLSHFDLLERHLAFYKEPDDYSERTGGSPLYGRLYMECLRHKEVVSADLGLTKCGCGELCECGWNDEKHLKRPWNNKFTNRPEQKIVLECPDCYPPPCTCQWRPIMFMGPVILTTLMSSFPSKYAQNYRHRRIRCSQMSHFKTNISILN